MAAPIAVKAVGALARIANGAKPKVCALGNSLVAQQFVSGSSQARGAIANAQARMGMSFEFLPQNCFGYAGQTSTTILTHVDEAIASGCEICVLDAFTNDATAGISSSTSLVNAATFIKRLTDAGIRVAVMAIAPRSTWGPLTGQAITDARQGNYNFNRLLRDIARGYGTNLVRVVNSDSSFLDPNSGNGDGLPGTTTDGLHEGNLGADCKGADLASTLVGWVPPLSATTRANPDRYNATLNPKGDLLVSRQFSGSVVTAVAGMSGDIATNWTPSRTGSAATGTWSIETSPAPSARRKQVLVLGTSGIGATLQNISLQFGALSGPDYTTGDTIQFMVDVEAIGLVNVENVQISLTYVVGGNVFPTFGLLGTNAASDRVLPDWRKTIATPPILLPAGVTSIYGAIRVGVDTSIAGLTGTLKFFNPSVCKI